MNLEPLDELQEFQDSQKAGVGSTDAAAILGFSPWATAFEVWERKLGLAPIRQPSLPMWLGKRLETIIADLYVIREQEAGRDTKLRYESDRQYRRRGEPWQVTHLDFRVRGNPRHIVEIKTDHKKDGWGEPGSADVPVHYWMQVQHQLAVVGGDVAEIAVLFGLRGFDVFRVPRDDDFIDKLTEAEREFWFTYVVTGKQPPIDHSESARKFLNRRHPDDDGLILPATPEQAELVDRYRMAEQNVKQAEQERDRLKNRLIEAIGDHAGLRGGDFELTYKRIKEGEPEVVWEMVYAGARRLLMELGVPENDERLEALVSLYTKPGRKGYRRWNLADRKG